MKNLKSLIILLLLTNMLFAQKITRGPELGEIYFKAPTYTGYGLYFSTDYGETAVCVDSITNILTIAADKTSGGIYYYGYPSSLYYSANFGLNESWVFKYSSTYLGSNILSGVEYGHIFSGAYMHSEDYGSSFITHTGNGFFGSTKIACINNVNENTGYVLSTKVTVPDTTYLFRTYDKFENVELIHCLEYWWDELLALARGYNSGEVFMFNFTRNNLWFSDDYFDTMVRVDTFNILDFGTIGIDGDNQKGGFYLLYAYVDSDQDIRHAYIFHSTDYGVTFDVFHPFARGNQPLMANFSSINKEPQLSNVIEFDNFSIGDVIEYQWDFENDGTIDSYDEYPAHIYEDTGYYSVKLTIVGADSSNTFIKEKYIHVIDTITPVISSLYHQNRIKLFPNPFSTQLTILLNSNDKNIITIYNNRGKHIKSIKANNKSIKWDGRNKTGQRCLPGIYYIKISLSIYKVLLTN